MTKYLKDIINTKNSELQETFTKYEEKLKKTKDRAEKKEIIGALMLLEQAADYANIKIKYSRKS